MAPPTKEDAIVRAQSPLAGVEAACKRDSTGKFEALRGAQIPTDDGGVEVLRGASLCTIASSGSLDARVKGALDR